MKLLLKPRAISYAIALMCCSFAANASNNATAPSVRIISAGSGVTELIFALKAQQALIAVDLTSRAYLQDEDIPVLGYHRQLSAEGLLALNPTHLIGSPEMGPESTLAQLAAANVTVQKLPTGTSLADFNQRIDAIAAITATQDAGEQIKAEVETKIQQLKTNVPKNKPVALFVMLAENRALTVAGADTTIDSIITLAGGHNLAAQTAVSYKPLSSEALLQMQPDYLLIAERTISQFGSLEKMIKQQPQLALTPAYKNNRIIAIPSHAIVGGFGLASLTLAQELNLRFTAKGVNRDE